MKKNLHLFATTILLVCFGVVMNAQIDTVFHYKFDGNLLDASGKNVVLRDDSTTATDYYNLDSTGASGLAGDKALYLSGKTGSFLAITDTGLLDPSKTDYTVCAWVKNQSPDDNYYEQVILHQIKYKDQGASVSAPRFYLACYGTVINPNTDETDDSDTLWVGTFISSEEKQSKGMVPKNEWTHMAIVGTVADSTVHFYINGKFDSDTVSKKPFEKAFGGFIIGKHQGKDQANWKGLIDDLYFMKGALAENDIAALAQKGREASISSPNISNLEIYPTPADDVLYINSSEAIQTVELYNIIGSRILSANNSTQLNVEGIATGTYILKVTTINGKVSSHKVVIK